MRRILSRTELAAECDRLRSLGRRIVFTNGCFDILHLGHVTYLEEARALGDALIVGVNSDASVQRLKGPTRPIVPEAERAAVLAALRAVDAVSIFDEDTPLELIEQVRPDVLVKGGDYDPAENAGPRMIVGSDIVRAAGGEVRVIPLVQGRSTTDTIERIRAAC